MIQKIKVLIVDDQALILDILSKGLNQDPSIEVVGTATDGYLALNQVNRLNPDVIVLDMEMPRMNGIQFLHNLMPVNPIPTIVLSALTQNDSKITDDAFEAGAVDFLAKPSGGANALRGLLIQLYTKIKIAATQDVKHFKKPRESYRLPPNSLDRQAKSNKIVLGMGAYEISTQVGKFLKIFALGSCIGLSFFCPPMNICALAHIALPNSSIDGIKADKLPGYFADTAIVTMLDQLNKMGCSNRQLIAKIAGGAKTRIEIGDYFGIGQRNILAVKAGLLKKGIKIAAEDVGGNISRTVSIEVGKTKMDLYYPEKGNWEI
ncbi:MAG: response regulator [Candidatus Kapabacteria bacterium]|nr:response regulator [Candidatus Kapabacteria bacterium]